jgi:hypothetical protein
LVRRLVCSFVLLSFALSLHASVPATNNTSSLRRAADVPFESRLTLNHSRPEIALTSSPADISFYDEFYPVSTAHTAQPKTSMLHWVSSLIKKVVRR